jgi:hypothetical protein
MKNLFIKEKKKIVKLRFCPKRKDAPQGSHPYTPPLRFLTMFMYILSPLKRIL